MDGLDKKRKEIDRIDNKIVELLEKRFDKVKKIIDNKRKNGVLVENLQREKEIKLKHKDAKLPKGFSDSFFDLLFKEAKKEGF
ncbi:MAG: chorismate mutase [Parcubacteria group bacterium]